MQNTLIEKNLSKYYHNYYISRTSSGTSALIVILKALTIESQKKSNYSFNSLSVSHVCGEFPRSKTNICRYGGKIL